MSIIEEVEEFVKTLLMGAEFTGTWLKKTISK